MPTPLLPPGFDFTDPDVYANRLPVEELAEVRRAAPVWWNAQLPDVGGFGEVAAAGAAALVAPGDAQALREAIAGLLADGERRRELSAAAASLAGGEWSWRRVAERTAALYRSLV